MTHNFLNEMHNSIAVLPDDAGLREKLKAWDGEIILGAHLNSGADLESDAPDDDAAAWFMPSPLELVEPAAK